MRLAIVGSRKVSANSIVPLANRLNDIMGSSDVIVSGGAVGVDSLAEAIAKARGIPTLIFQPDWKKYGKIAGFKRNQKIVDAADAFNIFWDGESPGTRDTIERVKKSGKNYSLSSLDARLIQYRNSTGTWRCTVRDDGSEYTEKVEG